LKIKDKDLKKMVDVFSKECLSKTCYWPRQNPGSFQTGRGYKAYGDSRDNEWVCGTREIMGCPTKSLIKEEVK